MRIKKIPMNGYDAYLYKTNKYTTMHMTFLFELEYTKENIYKCDLLDEYLMGTNKKYKTRKEIYENIESNYAMGFSINNYTIGKKLFVEVRFTFCDPELVKDGYLTSALEFAKDLLYLPNFENGKLDKEVLNKCKNNMIGSMANRIADPKYKAFYDFWNLILPNTYMTIDKIKTKEEYESLLNSFKDENLIQMYHEILDKSFVGLTLIGNFKDKHLQKIRELFTFKTVKKFDRKFDTRLKIKTDKSFFKESDADMNESIIYAVYECKHCSAKKKYIYLVIDMILNSTGRVMHKVLRDELKIIYSSQSQFYSRAGFLLLKASIDKNSLNKCLEGFNKVIEMLKDEDYVEEKLISVKEKINMRDYISDENKWNVIGDLEDRVYEFNISRKRENRLINSLTAKEVVDEVKKLEKKLTFFYEGVKE